MVDRLKKEVPGANCQGRTRDELVDALKHTVAEAIELDSRDAIDAAWALEAEERIDAYERGEIVAVPAEVVFGLIERKYSK